MPVYPRWVADDWLTFPAATDARSSTRCIGAGDPGPIFPWGHRAADRCCCREGGPGPRLPSHV